MVVGKKKITTKDAQRRSTPVETQTFLSNGCKVQSWTFSSLFFLVSYTENYEVKSGQQDLPRTALAEANLQEKLNKHRLIRAVKTKQNAQNYTSQQCMKVLVSGND